MRSSGSSQQPSSIWADKVSGPNLNFCFLNGDSILGPQVVLLRINLIIVCESVWKVKFDCIPISENASCNGTRMHHMTWKTKITWLKTNTMKRLKNILKNGNLLNILVLRNIVVVFIKRVIPLAFYFPSHSIPEPSSIKCPHKCPLIVRAIIMHNS